MAIQVPSAYQDTLKPIKNQDKRTDEEIFQSLLKLSPVGDSEKNVWAFWDSGFRNMPGWCQRNVVAWVRTCGPDWTIRVLDDVPESPNYAARYVPKDSSPNLPERFYARTLNDEYSGPHIADFLRGACLFKYGGVWMDCSIFLTRNMDDICWNELSDPASPYQVAVPYHFGGLLNCFIAARKGDPYIARWHDLFTEVWAGKENADGLAQHPLMAPIVPYFTAKFKKAGVEDMGLKASLDKMAEYGAQMVCWQRLTMTEKDKTGFACADYWVNHVAWIDCPKEVMKPFFNESMQFNPHLIGQGLFDILATPVDGNKDSQLYQDAEKLVWTQVTTASMIKVGTIKGMVSWISAATLWNMPENAGKDGQPGTFGEVLRAVPWQYKQTRKGVSLAKGVKSPVTFIESEDGNLKAAE
ncbi:hypothetical protein F5Y16DRAFT_326266 [Xylariaceae sp. FL0255]|nr:hypothetical protein F5Y16DRAFT_326266 [Xylariaceae sp. FL0255]